MLNNSLFWTNESIFQLTNGCIDWCQENADAIAHNNEVSGLIILVAGGILLLLYNILLPKQEKIITDIGLKKARFIFILLRELPFWLIMAYIANVILRWKYGIFK